MEIRHVPRIYSDGDFLAAIDGYGLIRPVWTGVFLPEVVGDHARLLVSWASEMDAIEFYERAARDGYMAMVFGVNHDTWRAGPIVFPSRAEWAIGNQERTLSDSLQWYDTSVDRNHFWNQAMFRFLIEEAHGDLTGDRSRVMVAEQEQEKSEGRVADVGGRTSRPCRGEADSGTGGITDVSGHAGQWHAGRKKDQRFHNWLRRVYFP
ncbi:hypothetical protein HDU88_008030 [Geranomyces variabilis]|nr:hypothetical protein HDU88_008030 [Geranomyces variabilis]